MNTSHRYEILLASVIAARATSFIFSKILLESMDTFALLGIRFLLAFLILALLFARHLIHIDRQVLFSGFVIGLLYFLLMISALRNTDSSMVSLLENCAIILVPLLNAFITWKIPSAKSILCALAAMLLMLVIVCTGFGYTLQPVAQSKVSIERSGLFCSINPAIATILGVIVLHEQFGILSVLGILLIIFSIMLPYLNFSKK